MDTAPGITDAEMRESVARAIWHKTYIHDTLLPWCEIKPGTMHHRRCIEAADHALAAMRAVASRTRQATPAPDEMAEAMEAFKELYTHCFCTPGPYEPPDYDLFARCLHVLSQPRASNAEALGTHQRTPEEFAIEFGEYMAKSAVSYMGMTQREWRDADVHSDRWNALNCAIYDFRKRAARTNAWLGEKPPLIESGASGPELGEEELRLLDGVEHNQFPDTQPSTFPGGEEK